MESSPVLRLRVYVVQGADVVVGQGLRTLLSLDARSAGAGAGCLVASVAQRPSYVARARRASLHTVSAQ